MHASAEITGSSRIAKELRRCGALWLKKADSVRGNPQIRTQYRVRGATYNNAADMVDKFAKLSDRRKSKNS